MPMLMPITIITPVVMVIRSVNWCIISVIVVISVVRQDARLSCVKTADANPIRCFMGRLSAARITDPDSIFTGYRVVRFAEPNQLSTANAIVWPFWIRRGLIHRVADFGCYNYTN